MQNYLDNSSEIHLDNQGENYNEYNDLILNNTRHNIFYVESSRICGNFSHIAGTR